MLALGLYSNEGLSFTKNELYQLLFQFKVLWPFPYYTTAFYQSTSNHTAAHSEE